MKLVLQITAGILLAFSIMSLTGLAFTAGMAYWADKQFQEVLAEQKAQRQEQRRKAESKQDAEVAKKREKEQRQLRRQQAIVDKRNTENQIDKAFKDQYEPPPNCVSPQSNTQWVKCVDLKRAARQQFSTQYLDPKSDRQDIKIISR